MVKAVHDGSRQAAKNDGLSHNSSAAILCGLLAAIAVNGGDLGGMFSGGLQHPAIQYYSRPVTDPAYELNRKIQEGTVHLEFDGAQGYLRSCWTP